MREKLYIATMIIILLLVMVEWIIFVGLLVGNETFVRGALWFMHDVINYKS